MKKKVGICLEVCFFKNVFCPMPPYGKLLILNCNLQCGQKLQGEICSNNFLNCIFMKNLEWLGV